MSKRAQLQLILSPLRASLTAALALCLWAVAAPSAQAQSDLCANPALFCGKALSPRCSRLGAGSQDSGCGAEYAAYRECVSAAAETCGSSAAAAPAGRSPGGCSPAEEKELWALAGEDGKCESYQAFLESCPEGRRAPFARSKLKILQCGGGGARAASTPTPSPTPTPRSSFTSAPAPTPGASTPQTDAGPAADGALAAAVQGQLKRLGYYRGDIDGAWGPQSAEAMRRYQRDFGLSPTGRPDAGAVARMQSQSRPRPKPASADTDVRNLIGVWEGKFKVASGRVYTRRITVKNVRGMVGYGTLEAEWSRTGSDQQHVVQDAQVKEVAGVFSVVASNPRYVKGSGGYNPDRLTCRIVSTYRISCGNKDSAGSASDGIMRKIR